VQIWVENIKQTLIQVDPQGSDIYTANAQKYIQQLTDLDKWIAGEISKIPLEQRKLVTDHQSLGYFDRRYGLVQAGLVIDSLSTNASPSAQDLARLEEVIKNGKIKAIFIEMGASDALAAQVAVDTGVPVLRIYTGTLGTKDSGAEDYLSFMRYNVNVIVNGLR
jgi:ABC-type Zn uptake system ZnuABC Zn-binding protein ZnuA